MRTGGVAFGSSWLKVIINALNKTGERREVKVQYDAFVLSFQQRYWVVLLVEEGVS